MWTFIRPSPCALAITSAGWIEPSSYSRSFGRISRSAKSCARSRSAFCSSVSPKETPPAVRSSMVAIAFKSSLTDWSVNRQPEPQDTRYMRVQLAAAGERDEDANRACCVRTAREEEQVRSGTGCGYRPLPRVSADDVERVGHGDALEPEVAKETVRARHQCRPTRTERRIDAVTNHDARHLRFDRRTVRGEVGFAHSTD